MILTDDQATEADRIARLTLRTLGARCPHTVDDVTQETMLQLLRTRQLRSEDIGAFVFVVTRRKYATHLGRRRHATLPDDLDLPAPPLPDDISEEVEHVLCSGITDKQLQVVIGLLCEKSLPEIAISLGVTRQAVHKRLKGIRRRLAPSAE